jgi:hypothetical protein
MCKKIYKKRLLALTRIMRLLRTIRVQTGEHYVFDPSAIQRYAGYVYGHIIKKDAPS